MNNLTEKAERIGIYGGTFNPIHIGHLLLARAAIEEAGLDRLLLMPSVCSHRKSTGEMLSPQTRSEMIALAIEKEDRMELSRMEIEGGITYTCDTVTALRRLYPQASLFFVLGSDSLMGIAGWKHSEQIFQNCQLLTAVRSGCDLQSLRRHILMLEQQFHASVTLISTRQFDLSSSEIRRRISLGKSVRYMVPDPVYEYLRVHPLCMETETAKREACCAEMGFLCPDGSREIRE